MSSVLLEFDVADRKRIAAGALAPLARALRAELDPIMRGPLPVPERKARLTRAGGRCSFDGTQLRFKPFAPLEHECPQCHRVFVGEPHNDWWAMGAQLWTAERAVQAAALHLVCDDAACGQLALRILTELAVRYRSWPNRDNALGPTRPFFSTYLESIWLLNLCQAISLLERAALSRSAADVLGEVRTTLIAPSCELIASFHEGLSNRQVWNEVAVLSALRTLGNDKGVEQRLSASGGLSDLFARGLLDDGTWYEGENYHLFAHRGLWYGVQLLQALGRPLSQPLEWRYRAGFITPFLGVLPDDTLPSRRDSQYRVTLRQWRFAEWCELGIAHAVTHTAPHGFPTSPDRTHVERQLSGLVHRLYDEKLPVGEAYHAYSTADAERNEPASGLTRANLSWRCLLMAPETLPPDARWSPESVCLPKQGLAVFRRDAGRTYVALEGGHTGGGHGHPDRLALTLQHDHTRWLEDPGTGSYVERTLHWYRSTLAHFAPLFDGASQQPVPAHLVAFEDRGGAGWVCKRATGIASGVDVTRTIVVADGYLVDVLQWNADRHRQIDLPLARAVDVQNDQSWNVANTDGAGGLEDGFDFLTDAASLPVDANGVSFTIPGTPAGRAYYACTGNASLFRADAPASPGHGRAPLHWLRTSGKSGHIVGVWAWGDSVTSVKFDGLDNSATVTVQTNDGTAAKHSRVENGWYIALTCGHATSSIELGGLIPVVNSGLPEDAPTVEVRAAIAIPRISRDAGKLDDQAGHIIRSALRFKLEATHYVPTEQAWGDAGAPVAIVQIGATADELIVDVLARTGSIVVPSVHDENLLDNERRDVNSDGVQLHIGAQSSAGWNSGWLAVPAVETKPEARVSALVSGTSGIRTAWLVTSDGWAMRAAIPLAHIALGRIGSFSMEVIVNERSADRQRRRGQLVFSGGGGFGYLRGDRADIRRAFTFRLPVEG